MSTFVSAEELAERERVSADALKKNRIRKDRENLVRQLVVSLMANPGVLAETNAFDLVERARVVADEILLQENAP